jgi:hypothetical protein
MPDDFSVMVGRWVDQAEGRAKEAFLAIGYAAVARVKQLTPVRTGNLRANWQLMRDGEQVPVVRKQGSSAEPGADGPRAGGGSAEDVKLGERLVIVNPVIYARAVEYGRTIQRNDGDETRVPGRGMMAQTISEIPEIATKAIRDLRTPR